MGFNRPLNIRKSLTHLSVTEKRKEKKGPAGDFICEKPFEI